MNFFNRFFSQNNSNNTSPKEAGELVFGDSLQPKQPVPTNNPVAKLTGFLFGENNKPSFGQSERLHKPKNLDFLTSPSLSGSNRPKPIGTPIISRQKSKNFNLTELGKGFSPSNGFKFSQEDSVSSQFRDGPSIKNSDTISPVNPFNKNTDSLGNKIENLHSSVNPSIPVGNLSAPDIAEASSQNANNQNNIDGPEKLDDQIEQDSLARDFIIEARIANQAQAEKQIKKLEKQNPKLREINDEINTFINGEATNKIQISKEIKDEKNIKESASQNSEDEIRKALQKTISPILKDGNPKNRTKLFNLLESSGYFNKKEIKTFSKLFRNPENFQKILNSMGNKGIQAGVGLGINLYLLEERKRQIIDGVSPNSLGLAQDLKSLNILKNNMLSKSFGPAAIMAGYLAAATSKEFLEVATKALPSKFKKVQPK